MVLSRGVRDIEIKKHLSADEVYVDLFVRWNCTWQTLHHLAFNEQGVSRLGSTQAHHLRLHAIADLLRLTQLVWFLSANSPLTIATDYYHCLHFLRMRTACILRGEDVALHSNIFCRPQRNVRNDFTGVCIVVSYLDFENPQTSLLPNA